MKEFDHSNRRTAGSRTFLLLVSAIVVPLLRAQTDRDFDEDRIRIGGFWFYSTPTVSFQDTMTGDVINLHKDFGFGSYSTVSGKLDWKSTRKNHFHMAGAPFDQSRTAVLQRTIVFQGQTFNVGVITKANLRSPLITPGYQYDIIRRKHGHLGLAVQIDAFNSNASLFAAAQVNNNNQVQSAKKSLLVPIPVAGSQFRFYLINSPRLFVDGNIYGMYFLGYGIFVSTSNDVGVLPTKHLSLNAGYQLGSRLKVNVDAKKDRLGSQPDAKGTDSRSRGVVLAAPCSTRERQT